MNLNSAPRLLQTASRHALQPRHAPLRICRQSAPAQRSLHLRTLGAPLGCTRLATPPLAKQARCASTAVSQTPSVDRAETSDAPRNQEADDIAARKAQEPAYELTFTCRKCLHRSSHRITKQAYHFGTTLITCPGCKNRHLISDHLKIFSDTSITIEDILREKGQLLKKGRLGEDGDIEFYDEENNEIGKMAAELSKNSRDGPD